MLALLFVFVSVALHKMPKWHCGTFKNKTIEPLNKPVKTD